MTTNSCENSTSVEEICYNNLHPSASDSPLPSQLPVNKILGEHITLVKNEADDELQSIMALIKQPNTGIQKLPAPCHEKFSTLLLFYSYMYDRLVVLKALRTVLQRLFYWKHPCPDETLCKSLDFW